MLWGFTLRISLASCAPMEHASTSRLCWYWAQKALISCVSAASCALIFLYKQAVYVTRWLGIKHPCQGILATKRNQLNQKTRNRNQHQTEQQSNPHVRCAGWGHLFITFSYTVLIHRHRFIVTARCCHVFVLYVESIKNLVCNSHTCVSVENAFWNLCFEIG